MGIFGKLFEQKKPAPSYEIHPDDKNLIKSQDIDWWKGLSMDSLKEIEQQDNVARMTAYTHFMESEGMSKEDAFPNLLFNFSSEIGQTFYGRRRSEATIHIKKPHK